MDGLFLSAVARMPLADGALRVWRWAVEPAFLDELYEQHRQRSGACSCPLAGMLSCRHDGSQ